MNAKAYKNRDNTWTETKVLNTLKKYYVILSRYRCGKKNKERIQKFRVE